MVAEPGAPPVVAVVVTCRPGTWLEETLRSLAAQDYPELSVLVVAVGDDDGAILVGHRLRRRCGKIDNRETAVTEADLAIRGNPGVGTIRAAMRHRIPHPFEHGAIDRAGAIRQQPDYSAHSEKALFHYPHQATKVSDERERRPFSDIFARTASTCRFQV